MDLNYKEKLISLKEKTKQIIDSEGSHYDFKQEISIVYNRLKEAIDIKIENKLDQEKIIRYYEYKINQIISKKK